MIGLINSFIFNIFGGTGDLAKKKLLPALYNLYKKDLLPESFKVISIGRRDYTKNQYVNFLMEDTKFSSRDKQLDDFLEKIAYFKMDFDDSSKYKELDLLNKELGSIINGDNRIFYFATPPSYFEVISNNLSMFYKNNHKNHQMVLVEKPFGSDLKSAEYFNDKLEKAFDKNDIYRIDHYLGKEMIQNILTMRFTNQLFKNNWSKDSIENIKIAISENIGIEERLDYYDSVGALRDMVQNHLLQILSFLTLDRPYEVTIDTLKKEKLNILKKLRPFTPESIRRDLVLGQYDGYPIKSDTETYVALKTEIQTEKWQGVPIYMMTGKYLNEKKAEILITFKKDSSKDCFFNHEQVENNLLAFKIQPTEGVYLRINSKVPGNNDVSTVSLDYCQSCNTNYSSPEAYEKLLFDCINEDKTLFASWEEIKYSWMFIDSITKSCEVKKKTVLKYAKGSENLKESINMIGGGKWFLD